MSKLFKAIRSHDLAQIKDALASSTDVNLLSSEHRWTALHEAVNELEEGCPVQAIKLLLQHGANANAWDLNKDSTPLLMAVFRNQKEAVEILLKAGANPNVRGGEGDSPLRFCAEQGFYDIAVLLLDYGAAQTINEGGGPSGMSALGRAVWRSDLGFIDLLLNAGADPQACDLDRRSALGILSVSEFPDEEARAIIKAKLTT
jgi:ankyrin repeat protein